MRRILNLLGLVAAGLAPLGVSAQPAGTPPAADPATPPAVAPAAPPTAEPAAPPPGAGRGGRGGLGRGGFGGRGGVPETPPAPIVLVAMPQSPATVELLLPEGATATVDGKDAGSERLFKVTQFDLATQVQRVEVKVKYADSTE
ncbi:MAG: hypothetical protein ABIZ49_09365, partial [Opitutaceae bacterium]